MNNRIKGTLIVLLTLWLIQLIPYGPRPNPPVRFDPKWDSIATKRLFDRACTDCHSNRTRWPAYARYAPISWLIASDVNEGREHFNISESSGFGADTGRKAAQAIREGEMPPWIYKLMHPEARLSGEERSTLARGLERTFGAWSLHQMP